MLRRPEFEIRKNTKGEYYFVLKAGNGEIVFWGEGYTNYTDAERGAETAKRLARHAKIARVVRTDPPEEPTFPPPGGSGVTPPEDVAG